MNDIDIDNMKRENEKLKKLNENLSQYIKLLEKKIKHQKGIIADQNLSYMDKNYARNN